MDILQESEWLKRLRARENPARTTYRAMYSSWWNGIVTDPVLMTIPMDDHQVHRGDGIFEAVKVVHGKYWLLTPHLERMQKSADLIGLKMPWSRSEIEKILQETLKVSKLQEAIVRIFVSRGPGTFSPNPYDSVGPQLHVVVTDFKPYPAAKYEAGAKVGFSATPAKESWLARIKSCNYLQNVLIRKEAVDRKLDFLIAVDHEGFITESSTENIMIVDRLGRLICPKLNGILAGTTMKRSMKLAEKITELKGIAEDNFSKADLQEALEVMMVGTTLDILPVTEIEGRKVGDGKPGQIAKKLKQLLSADQASS